MHTNERITGFNATSSSVRAETVVKFVQLDLQFEDIQCVPGVGPALAQDLTNAGISTPIQLLGKFLSLCSIDEDDVCNAFYNFIKEINARANAHTVTFSIASYADEKGLITYET